VDEKEHTGVVCRRCAAHVVVHAPEKVAEEFSVVCPKCGHRDFYRIKELRTINPR
jgi:DNA-directed RNA polymerase subunit RPC12/RpoP